MDFAGLSVQYGDKEYTVTQHGRCGIVTDQRESLMARADQVVARVKLSQDLADFDSMWVSTPFALTDIQVNFDAKGVRISQWRGLI